MLKWMDGFEQYGNVSHMVEGVGGGAAWSQVDTWGWSLVQTNPATGDWHLRLSDSDTEDRIIRRVFGVAKQVTGIGYRFNVAELPELESDGALVLADFRDVSNVGHVMIVMGTDGSVFAKRGGSFGGAIGGTLLGRSDPCIAPGGYHHFECKTKIDNATGYIEVRVNQVTVLNLTGIDTQNTANAASAQVAIGQSGNALSGSVAFGTFDLDDSFAWDDDATDPENTVVDFIGDKGAYWLPVNGDTATAEFTKTGSVTSYGAIDEVPPSGVDYLNTSAAAARTILEVAALPGNVSEVIAFMPVIYARKDESGPVTLRGGVISGTDEAYGPDDDPSTEYAYLRPGPKTIDPATGVAWANDADPKLLIERTA
jgi:hypothetical protein